MYRIDGTTPFHADLLCRDNTRVCLLEEWVNSWRYFWSNCTPLLINEFELDRYQLGDMERSAGEVAFSVCFLLVFLLLILNVAWISSVVTALYIYFQFLGTALLITLGIAITFLLPFFLYPTIRFYFLSRAIQDYKRKMHLLNQPYSKKRRV